MHISSLSHMAFALLNGETSPGAFVSASLRVGGNDVDGRTLPEFDITNGRIRAPGGRLTWDAEHRINGSSSRFFSVAAVRLDVKPDECLLSVGTGEFLRLATEPYRWIEKVQISAAAWSDAPGRVIQWDSIELVMSYSNGQREVRRSNCLPRVTTEAPVRRAAMAPETAAARIRQQFAEIATGCRDVVALNLRAQVTLRANEPGAAASPLGPEDLSGRILVFTDATGRRP